MSPQLATILCIILILYLFWIDRKKIEGVSKAIWISTIWMFLSGSRTISQWFDLGTPNLTADVYLEGNPIDRNIFTILIIAGLFILYQRRSNMHEFFSKNKWIWLYFAFGMLSLVWSDYPFVSFKRLIKALGTVIMVLVVLTEDQPYIAIGVILRRIAFVLLPLSVLFIKYYPELGRIYWMGEPMYTGVGLQKNALGQLCLITGIYFSWNIFLGRKEKLSGQQLHYSIYLIVLPLIIWLFFMAHSSTSLACMLFTLILFGIARQPVFASNPRKIMIFGIICIFLLAAMESFFDIKEIIIALLGRESNLTGRTDIWDKYLSMVKDPILGYGYESFYTTVIINNTVEDFLSAHNGYLEMYLNLGIIGLLFVAGWIVTGLIKVWHQLVIDYPVAILRLAIIIDVILYNWTEATFAGRNNVWFLLFFAIMTVPNKMESVTNKDSSIHTSW